MIQVPFSIKTLPAVLTNKRKPLFRLSICVKIDPNRLYCYSKVDNTWILLAVNSFQISLSISLKIKVFPANITLKLSLVWRNSTYMSIKVYFNWKLFSTIPTYEWLINIVTNFIFCIIIGCIKLRTILWLKNARTCLHATSFLTGRAMLSNFSLRPRTRSWLCFHMSNNTTSTL